MKKNKQKKTPVVYKTDKIANLHGHEVLRTLVRHCELNPIELIWALEGEVSTLSSKGKLVLIGDFNSRTGQNPDFIEKDSSQINDFDGVDLLPPDYVTDTELKRVNQDCIINSHGNKLLDLCLSSRLCILNGRFLGD